MLKGTKADQPIKLALLKNQTTFITMAKYSINEFCLYN